MSGFGNPVTGAVAVAGIDVADVADFDIVLGIEPFLDMLSSAAAGADHRADQSVVSALARLGRRDVFGQEFARADARRGRRR